MEPIWQAATLGATREHPSGELSEATVVGARAARDTAKGTLFAHDSQAHPKNSRFQTFLVVLAEQSTNVLEQRRAERRAPFSQSICFLATKPISEFVHDAVTQHVGHVQYLVMNCLVRRNIRFPIAT